MNDDDRPGDAELAAEVVDQLRGRHDDPDATKMRIEELVRDTEYEETSHRDGSRASPLLMLSIAAGVVALVVGWFWLRSMCW